MNRIVLAALVAAGWVVSGSAQIPQAPLQLAPLGASGEAVFPAFEGWGPSKDGQQNVLLIGY
ncbi:MAG: hypothetical protein ABI665_29325, partial [Vicinamibacterales bacterium]